jgi:TP901 family phage tail tape measure protein
MSDFQVSVGGDFQELLRGFQQLEARAQQAGQNVGKGIGDGIQGFSSRSLAALNQELNRLQQRQTRVDVNSEAFTKAGVKIREVQGLIDAVQQNRASITVDDRSIAAVQARLTDLQNRQTKVSVDSTEFAQLQRQINAAEKELQQISQRKVLIDADGNSFLALTTKLKNELNDLQQRQLKVDVDSQEFIDLGKEIDRVESELSALDRRRTSITVDSSSVQALQTKLSDLQTRQTKVSVNSQEFADLQVKIDRVQQELADVERKKVLINVDGNSLTALTTRLKAELTSLEQRRLTVNIDSQEFVTLSRDIDRVEKELTDLDQRKLLITADPSSIVALQSKLGVMRQELDKTQIGSKRFQELQAEIRKTETELNKATGATNGFQGAMQKLAPALAALGLAGIGVGQALRGIISGTAQFDMEVRKAAAIEGGRQFDALKKSIEDVAAVAAGTPTEVAVLATALSRAGFSAEETKAALGGIVTGAEATSVEFAAMGSIVADTLRAFGLEATKTTDVVDTLVNAANSSNQTVLDLGESFKYAAPVARNLGVSVDDLAATMALLANNGIRGSEAGTALRTGLTRLQIAAGGSNEELLGLTRGSEILTIAMRKLGAEVLDANGNLKPMDEVILSLRQNINGFDTTKRAEIVKALFGEEQGPKFLALLNSSEKDIRSLFGVVRNSGGVAADTRKEMDSFALSFDVLRGNVEIVTNAIGGAFLAVLKPLIDGLNAAVGVTQALPKPVRDLAGAFAAAGIAAAGSVIAIGVFKVALTGLKLEAVIASITGVVVALKANLAGAATVAIVAVGKLTAGLKALSAVTVTQALTPLVAVLKVGLAGAANLVTVAFTKLSAAITSGALISGLKSFGTAIIANNGALLKLGISIGLAVVAVKVWTDIIGAQTRVSNEFEGSSKAISEALVTLGVDLDKTAEKAKKTQGGLLGLGAAYRGTVEGWSLLRLIDETNKMDEGFEEVFSSAVKFFNELKNSKEITDEQKKKAQEYIAELSKVSDAYKKQSERAKELAVEQARLGNQDLAKFYESQAKSLASNAQALDNLRQGTEKQIGVEGSLKNAVEQTAEAQEKAKEALQARADAEAELNRVIAEAPVRQADAQLALGTQLVGIAKALADAEQSRFAVVKSGLQFELQELEKRGASEQVLAAKKAEIAAADQAALSARYRALTQQQALEQVMLDLSQRKARLEADLSVQQQRVELLKAQKDLNDAMASGDQLAAAAAQAQVDLQQQVLGVTQEKAAILAQTQPIEQAIAAATAEVARNGLQSQAAAEGFRINADGSLTAVRGVASALEGVSVTSKLSADGQERFRRIAEQSGLAIDRAADGSVVLGRNQAEVARAVGALNTELNKGRAAVDATGRAATTLGRGIANAANPAGALEGSFTKTGQAAPAIVQGSRDFAAFLSGAKGSGQAIERLSLDSKFRSVASSMGTAANSARSFYDWLRQAAALPGARWTGGPVDAGAEYRVNELGQEAFLSAGRLSLIDKPANAIWRAPSSGVVIPAGVTSRLQEQGVLQGQVSGQSSGVATLAIEVGKLREEVGNLARRDWNIHVQQRTGPTASQVMNQIHRLR